MERLQKILSARGVASRRAAEEWIKAGRVSVNGRTAALGDTADPEKDDIRVDGKQLPRQEKLLYLMLHKPRGYVTTLHDEKGRPDAARLVADCGARVYPIGRLDMDSEGLLLFTNDGAFANLLMHPSHEVEKAYEVLGSRCWSVPLCWTAIASARQRCGCWKAPGRKPGWRWSSMRAGTGRSAGCARRPEWRSCG